MLRDASLEPIQRRRNFRTDRLRRFDRRRRAGYGCAANGTVGFGDGSGGRAPLLRLSQNAFHPRKGKPSARVGRKATDHRRWAGRLRLSAMAAGLPKGWAGEVPVHPAEDPLRSSVPDSGPPHRGRWNRARLTPFPLALNDSISRHPPGSSAEQSTIALAHVGSPAPTGTRGATSYWTRRDGAVAWPHG